MSSSPKPPPRPPLPVASASHAVASRELLEAHRRTNHKLTQIEAQLAKIVNHLERLK